ncbi:MAG: NADH-quinone oxidoreductase subunit M, partial [Rhodobiaceae bacterium]|nr:NADH-quinone oxidoreductase subunit M [Rhodobiaceae bacterium]
MENWPILSIITFTPLIGVLFILLINSDDEIGQRNIKLVAAYTTLVTFVVSTLIWINFDITT